jgi:ABC-type sugar transport system permease subunit
MLSERPTEEPVLESAPLPMSRGGDLAFAIIVAMYGLGLIGLTSMQEAGMAFDSLGPRGLPYATGAVLLLIGGLLVFHRVRHWSEPVTEEGAPDEIGYPASFWRAAAVAGVTFGYVALLPILGFLLATPLYLVVGLKVLDRGGWKTLVLVPLLFTVVMYAIFSQALTIPLPVGPLGDLLESLGLLGSVH